MARVAIPVVLGTDQASSASVFLYLAVYRYGDIFVALANFKFDDLMATEGNPAPAAWLLWVLLNGCVLASSHREHQYPEMSATGMADREPVALHFDLIDGHQLLRYGAKERRVQQIQIPGGLCGRGCGCTNAVFIVGSLKALGRSLRLW